MNYQTFDAHKDLANLVKCYWILQVPKEMSSEKQQILPDGCMELIFNTGDPIRRYIDKDEFIIQPEFFVVGQISKPFIVEPTGEVETFSVRFFPGGLTYFTKMPMADLADKETVLEELFDKSSVAKLQSEYKKTRELDDRIHLVENFLFETLLQNTDVDELLANTLDIMFKTKGAVGVNNILESNQNKRRQLERKFSKKIGLSPKQLCRIIRLQSSLKTMLLEKKKLTDIGFESDYYDQAHFINDFKAFAGVSPKEFYSNHKFLLSSIFYSEE